MIDVHSPETRSFNMSRVKNKDTKPELIVRRWLWSNGYRYRLHAKGLPGKPDIYFPGKQKAIFINGCFWHRHNCHHFSWPKARKVFWQKKITDNVNRDSKNYKALSAMGWKVLIIWECQIDKGVEDSVASILTDFIEPL